jgi:thiamine biosynthesis lipoprotein ApbE
MVPQHITTQSKGAFDITVGPMVQLWRHTKEGIPDATAIEQSTKNVGIEIHAAAGQADRF